MFRSKWLVSLSLASLLLLAAEEPLAAQTIDPAVASLGAVMKKASTFGTGEIEIVGIVRNIGTKDFKSGAGQQSVRLYAQAPGGKPTVVKEWAFTSLKAGASVTYRYIRRWDPRRPSNPDFIMQIDLDPDLYADGNPNNDDVNQMNNRRTLAARTIDSLFDKRQPKDR